jgi:hypothetical protein
MKINITKNGDKTMDKTNKTNKTLYGLFLAAIGIVSLLVGSGCGSTKEDYAKAIECVYNQLEMYDNMVEKAGYDRESIKQYTISVKTIDVSDCPEEFRNAYNEYAMFLEEFNQFMKDVPIGSLEKWAFTFAHFFDNKAYEMIDAADGYTTRGYEIQAKMNSIASKYGVVFDKEGHVVYSRLKQNE